MAAIARVATVNLVSAFMAFFLRAKIEPGAEHVGHGSLALDGRYVPYVALQQALCCAAAMRRMHELIG
jgi:hypothetical protein